MFKFSYCDSIYTEKENGITKFRIGAQDLEKWMYQNSAEYIGDFVDGCLLDNFVVITKRGYAAVYEHYVNEWCSDFYIEFQPGTANNVINAWYEFIDKLEDENNEI